MGKKCPPGVICIENMTLFMLIVSLCVLLYIYNIFSNNKPLPTNTGNTHYHTIKQMPVNVETQAPLNNNYNQVGILSRNKNDDVIMPLYGRKLIARRDNWQYYTITEHNVRLPINVRGKSSTTEYGCDELFNGDNVYVQGYNDAFYVTIYDDTNRLEYIPYVQ